MRKKFVQICLFILVSHSTNLFASDVRLISVSGIAEKNFSPDIVRIHITVWGKGASANSAQASNIANFATLTKSIETYKIKKEDIITSSYELNPEYVYNQKTNKNMITGYIANQNLVVTLRDVSKAAPFVDSLSKGGININSLSFDLDKKADEERALLADAVKVAEAQAEILAKAAKVKLKGIYRLAPRGLNSPSPMRMAHMEMDVLAKNSGGATQLMSGEVKVESVVFVDYLIE